MKLGSPKLQRSHAEPPAAPESPALEPALLPSSKMRRAFPSEIDMLVKDHGEVEDPELMDARRLRRNSTRAGLGLHSDGTSPIDKGHTSLMSIFDLGDVSSPKSPGAGAVDEKTDVKAAKRPPPMPPIPGSPAAAIANCRMRPQKMKSAPAVSAFSATSAAARARPCCCGSAPALRPQNRAPQRRCP